MNDILYIYIYMYCIYIFIVHEYIYIYIYIYISYVTMYDYWWTSYIIELFSLRVGY